VDKIIMSSFSLSIVLIHFLFFCCSINAYHSTDQLMFEMVSSHAKHLVSDIHLKDSKLDLHPFNDVLVFVHINHDVSITQAQTYVKMWRGVFPRMVLFGEWNHDKIVELHKLKIPAIACPFTDNGQFAQVVLLKGIEMYRRPAFKGYMYIHDDLLISPSHVLTLDKTKLWISSQLERV
jgi:hypothetical protein